VKVIIGPLAGLFGAYLGYQISMDSAQTEEERRIVKRFSQRIGMSVLTAQLVMIPLLVVYGDAMVHGHPWIFVAMLNFFVAIFVVILVRGSAWLKRQQAGLVARAVLVGAASPPRSHARFAYRSKMVVLGLPLVHMNFGGSLSEKHEPVRGWIAGGGMAFGGLFAFGGVAIAPIALGGVAVGAVALGGYAAGLLAGGGFGFGICALGGVAEGWEAAGGMVLGWKAAFGGMALARDFAVGGTVQALHANDAMARQFMRDDSCFRSLLAITPHVALWWTFIPFISFIPLLAWRRWLRSSESRRRP
jgi:hypothetical protein